MSTGDIEGGKSQKRRRIGKRSATSKSSEDGRTIARIIWSDARILLDRCLLLL